MEGAIKLAFKSKMLSAASSTRVDFRGKPRGRMQENTAAKWEVQCNV